MTTTGILCCGIMFIGSPIGIPGMPMGGMGIPGMPMGGIGIGCIALG